MISVLAILGLAASVAQARPHRHHGPRVSFGFNFGRPMVYRPVYAAPCYGGYCTPVYAAPVVYTRMFAHHWRFIRFRPGKLRIWLLTIIKSKGSLKAAHFIILEVIVKKIFLIFALLMPVQISLGMEPSSGVLKKLSLETATNIAAACILPLPMIYAIRLGGTFVHEHAHALTAKALFNISSTIYVSLYPPDYIWGNNARPLGWALPVQEIPPKGWRKALYCAAGPIAGIAYCCILFKLSEYIPGNNDFSNLMRGMVKGIASLEMICQAMSFIPIDGLDGAHMLAALRGK